MDLRQLNVYWGYVTEGKVKTFHRLTTMRGSAKASEPLHVCDTLQYSALMNILPLCVLECTIHSY